ncbi:nitroreductase family protein [Desulfosporosinus fructosivorans]|uniref:Nitroreductase family protein n=2 Tax=Desulfosporosinus fructosivorans TaxID=2018669 RepID=A0A4Z0QXB5_9FIRM|nr:nitroreductase family protein [Desulfosporosinus fructosivorans]TGE34949.1 nitroreductase family protein [Desulfosporosinus fructosivorans]
MIRELIEKNRTYRRFYQDVEVSQETLRELIDLARLSSTGGNLQSLKFFLSQTHETNTLIFKTLKWAGYFKDWDGPEEGEKPSAYVVVLHDQRISKGFFWDQGIAVQSILLGATEKGLGGCQFNSVDRVTLAQVLTLPDHFEILTVIAIGKPKEVVVIEELSESGNIKYWRDQQGIHHVPKRALDDLIFNL